MGWDGYGVKVKVRIKSSCRVQPGLSGDCSLFTVGLEGSLGQETGRGLTLGWVWVWAKVETEIGAEVRCSVRYPREAREPLSRGLGGSTGALGMGLSGVPT